MNRIVLGCTGVALIAAAGAGLVASGIKPPARAVAVVTTATAAEPGAPIYYQDPDGKPDYSPTPKKTADGRDYIAVRADADSRSDKNPAPAAMSRAADRKIKYYRN